MIALADSAIGKPMEIVAATRLAIDTRKWALSKLLPKKFGEKAAEVNNNVSVHNHLHVTQDQIERLQQRHRELIQNGSR